MKDNTITIKQLLDQYLQEQEKRLAPRTFKHYKDAISFFEKCCDGYGHLSLNEEQNKQYDKNLESEVEFCEYFGPEVLDYGLFAELVGYFIPKKVMVGYDSARSMCRAAIHCYKWFCRRGYIKDEHENMTADELRMSFEDGYKEWNKGDW